MNSTCDEIFSQALSPRLAARGERLNSSGGPLPGRERERGTNGGLLMEEKVIASWKYKKGALDARTAYLCYLAANLAAGNTH